MEWVLRKKIEEMEYSPVIPLILNLMKENCLENLIGDRTDFLMRRLVDYDEKMEYCLSNMEEVELPLSDYELQQIHIEKMKEKDYMDMMNERMKLPIFQLREKIVEMVRNNQVVLLSGDTGCGKTTQVPQFLLDSYINEGKGSKCKIVCTQPRRISAVSVAERVAKERAEDVGVSSGYLIRLEKQLPRKYGSVLFATSGIVLRMMESNPTLNGISHLILDEVHERDTFTDFLLAMVKQVLTKRMDLKVILMSATLNDESFKKYFNYCPHLRIDRQVYPVKEYFLEDVVELLNYAFSTQTKRANVLDKNIVTFNQKVIPLIRWLRKSASVLLQISKPNSEEMNYDLIFQLTQYICRKGKPGAILIFVAGYEDIRILKSRFSQFSLSGTLIITLHSQNPIEEQKEVFDAAPPNMRKIIISTNIAETSVTIDDVAFVIDSGWSKVKTYDARTKTENLDEKFISKANAIQRKGRAGRTCPGECYRLYTSCRYQTFHDYPKPEIMRSRLEGIILQTKLLGFKSANHFFKLLIDQPREDIVQRSINLLKNIGAFKGEEELTTLGYYMAKLPMSPQLGKMLVFGVLFKCLDPILNIIVALDYKNPFLMNNLQTDHSQILKYVGSCQSDHILLHKVLKAFFDSPLDSRASLCARYNLNIETLDIERNMKHKFMEYLVALGLVSSIDSEDRTHNENSNNLSLVTAIIGAGLYPNYCTPRPILPGRNSCYQEFFTSESTIVGLHKKSLLFSKKFPPDSFLMYYIKLKCGKFDLIHDATIVQFSAIALFGLNHSFNSRLSSIKKGLDQYIEYKLTRPGSFDEESEEYETRFLRLMVKLLSS